MVVLVVLLVLLVVLVVLMVLVVLVVDSARPAFEAGESRGGEEERGLLTGYFYFSARRTHTHNC